MTRKTANPKAKTKFHLNVDRDTELKVIGRSKAAEKKKSLVPVRVNAKTIIFIEKGRNKEQAIANFLKKLDAFENPEIPHKGGRRRKNPSINK